MSEHLWLYEGLTEYFAHLIQLKESIISKRDFFDRFRDKIYYATGYSNRYSLTETSKGCLTTYQNQYGKLISVQNIEDNTNIIGVFSCEKIDHTKDANFNSDLLLKATFKKVFLNAKVGDSLKLNISKIFKDENELHKITGIEEEKLNEVDEIDFKSRFCSNIKTQFNIFFFPVNIISFGWDWTSNY